MKNIEYIINKLKLENNIDIISNELLSINNDNLSYQNIINILNIINKYENELYRKNPKLVLLTIKLYLQHKNYNFNIAKFPYLYILYVNNIIGKIHRNHIIISTVRLNNRTLENMAIKYLPINIYDNDIVNIDIYDKLCNLNDLLSNNEINQHIGKIIGITTNISGNIGIVMEKYNTNLYDFILNNSLSYNDKKLIFIQCITVIKILHNSYKNNIYNNIKPQNFLINNNNIIISDFIFSYELIYHIKESISTQQSTISDKYIHILRWLSPNIKNHLINGTNIIFDIYDDIYAIGLLSAFILTNILPYNKCKTDYQIYNNKYPIYDIELFNIDNNNELSYIYKWCLNDDIDKKPKSCDEIIEYISNQ